MDATPRPTQPAAIDSQGVGGGKPRRLWMGAVLVGLFWAMHFALHVFDSPISTDFLSNVGGSILLVLLFSIWWLTNFSVPRDERWLSWTFLVLGALVAAKLSDSSIGFQGMLYIVLALAVTIWFVWICVARNWVSRARTNGLLVVFAVVWALVLVTRVDGVDGNNNPTLSFRWGTSAEDRYVQQLAKETPAAVENSSEPVTFLTGDWADFRGPDRQGELRGVEIATDWNTHPPKELWRRPIGPAWSSVLIVDGRLFTQEQRGESEAVVCLDAATGRELWAHEDKVRFSDGQAGPGPRATPMFSAGRIYSLGATGVLNCLDAATGKRYWTRDIVADTKAPLPVWGFSSAPLVTENRVVVFAGAPPDKGLVAYDRETGEPAWTATTGDISYSSAQLATLDGVPQILFFSNAGLTAVEPESGELLWNYEAAQIGIWRVDQPRVLPDGGVLIGCEDLGLLRVDVGHAEGKWTPVEAWRSRDMRPAYNDFVELDGVVYGFDEGIFAAVDAKTGKRRWKGGRYGHGQVLLLVDQRVLLVISESGEAVLLTANPKKHDELGRFQAVTGKTWNHPVVAHGRLYIRNDQEMACFELSGAADQREAEPSSPSAAMRDGLYKR